MLIYTNQTSKKTRRQKLKQKQAWETQQARYSSNVKVKAFKPLKTVPVVVARPGAEDYRTYKSANSNNFDVYKPAQKVYTGDAMIGIATLHKSNAVPVFTVEEAVDISNMRRG
jgi:hypothetical protein